MTRPRDVGTNGVWPDGEPPQVRALYDQKEHEHATTTAEPTPATQTPAAVVPAAAKPVGTQTRQVTGEEK